MPYGLVVEERNDLPARACICTYKENRFETGILIGVQISGEKPRPVREYYDIPLWLLVQGLITGSRSIRGILAVVFENGRISRKVQAVRQHQRKCGTRSRGPAPYTSVRTTCHYQVPSNRSMVFLQYPVINNRHFVTCFAWRELRTVTRVHSL